MTESLKPPMSSHSGVGTELGVIEEAALTIRRMQANEEFGEDGIRTIWHRGRGRVEMLSWENRENVIVRQELSVFGTVVEFREGKSLRTGGLPQDEDLSDSGRPMGKAIKYEEIADERSLEYASHLLRHIENRDFYTQHLLKEVNDAIARLGFDAARTGVASLVKFPRTNRKDVASRAQATPAGGFFARQRRTLLIVALCAVAGIGGGVILRLLFDLF